MCKKNTINGKRYIGSSVDLRIRFLPAAAYFNTNNLIKALYYKLKYIFIKGYLEY